MDCVSADADAWHDPLRFAAAIALALLCLTPSLYGDGGILQFRKHAASFTISLFTAPVPLRVGRADLSVLIQNGNDSTIVDGAEVSLQLMRPGERPIDVPATAGQATNKLLYAAAVDLPAPGEWGVRIAVSHGANHAITSGDITVLPHEPPILAHWPEFALVPVIILLYIANRWLAQRRQSRVKASRYSR
jgi:hypothetical protein